MTTIKMYQPFFLIDLQHDLTMHGNEHIYKELCTGRQRANLSSIAVV